jgi:hypothetical protein
MPIIVIIILWILFVLLGLDFSWCVGGLMRRNGFSELLRAVLFCPPAVSTDHNATIVKVLL